MEIATYIACFGDYNDQLIIQPGIDIGSRLNNLMNALVSDELIEAKVTPHPNVLIFLETWKEYISLPTEDIEKYTLMKKQFINAFGEKWFQEWLFYSYYFVRSATMAQRNWVDNNNREIGY